MRTSSYGPAWALADPADVTQMRLWRNHTTPVRASRRRAGFQPQTVEYLRTYLLRLTPDQPSSRARKVQKSHNRPQQTPPEGERRGPPGKKKVSLPPPLPNRVNEWVPNVPSSPRTPESAVPASPLPPKRKTPNPAFSAPGGDDRRRYLRRLQARLKIILPPPTWIVEGNEGRVALEGGED